MSEGIVSVPYYALITHYEALATLRAASATIEYDGIDGRRKWKLNRGDKMKVWLCNKADLASEKVGSENATVRR